MTKDFATALRELGIPILILLLLVWPHWVANRLHDAGIIRIGNSQSEVQWQDPIEKSAQKTADAGQKFDTVRQAVAAARDRIGALLPSANPDLKRSLSEVDEQLQASLSTAQSASETLAESAQLQKNILPTQPSATQSGTGAWVVVISADKTLSPANWEVHRANREGYQKVAIYQRKGFFRAAITFDSKDAAGAALSNIQTKLRDSSYIVNVDNWCPSRTLQGDGTYECSSSD